MIGFITRIVPVWLWAALVATCAAGWAYSHTQALQARTDLATLQADTALATAAQQARTRQREADLQTDIDAARQQLTESQTHAQQTQNRLRADIGAGRVRLSVPTTHPAICPGPSGAPGTDPATASAAGPDRARTELDPATADALVSIAADGDTAIRERNVCIQLYNAARQALSAD